MYPCTYIGCCGYIQVYVGLKKNVGPNSGGKESDHLAQVQGEHILLIMHCWHYLGTISQLFLTQVEQV